MKSSALLVNAARGGIVDEEALARAINAGEIAGAALDVFGKEPIDSEHPLLGLDNVLCTPHLGASTSEAQERVAVEIAEQAIGYLQLGIVKNAVNVPALPQEIAERLKPYLDVAKLLGSLVGQLDPVDVRELRVTCTGEAGELGVTPIARAASGGLPRASPRRAGQSDQRALRGTGARHPPRRGQRAKRPVRHDRPRDRHRREGHPHGNRHTGPQGRAASRRPRGLRDRRRHGGPHRHHAQPGPTRRHRVGWHPARQPRDQRLADAGGLDQEGGQALALWNVDSTMSSDALDELRAIEYVSSVHTLRL